jgi:hypothetical protein
MTQHAPHQHLNNGPERARPPQEYICRICNNVRMCFPGSAAADVVTVSQDILFAIVPVGMPLAILVDANHEKVTSAVCVAVNCTTSRTAPSDVLVISTIIDELARLGQTSAGSAYLTPP